MGGGHDIHSVHVLDLFTGPLEQQRLSLIERGYVLEEIVILTANISLILDVESRGFHIEIRRIEDFLDIPEASPE